MKNAIARTLSPTQLAIRAAVFTSISFAVFLFAACDSNAPSGQSDQNPISGPQGLNGSLSKTAAVPLGAASTFAVLGGTTVTNAGPSLITGDLGVYPGTAITGFDPAANTIVYGPGGTVTGTPGMGIVNGTIYAGGDVGSVVEKAHNDAVTAYNYLVAQVPDVTNSGVVQLDGRTYTPGVYKFDTGANLEVGGTLTLDFQGKSDALFIFQVGTTLVTMADSKVIAIHTGGNSQTCSGSNVYWAVGSSATIDGAEFLGTVIAYTTITMTSAANTPVSTIVSGRMLALHGEVTMSTDNISVCAGSGGGPVPPPPCRDFVTGGGWIVGPDGGKATFGVSGGMKNGKVWGQLSYNNHSKNNGVKVKSTSVTAYTVIDAVTRQIDGIAKVNGKGSFPYTVVVVDNGEPGRNDSFSLQLTTGYNILGNLMGGNIQLHTKCGDSHDKDGKDDKENYDDKNEKDGNDNCEHDGDWK